MGNMLTAKSEENRGLFVLGVIAVLIVLHYDQTIRQSTWVIPVDILLVSWTSYAFLAVIALSKDIFGPRLSHVAYAASQFTIGSSLWYVVSFGLLYILWTLVPPFEVQIAKCASGCLLTINVWSSWSLFGILPAFFFPPLPVARTLSRTHGRKIWILYPIIVALLGVVAVQLLPQSVRILICSPTGTCHEL
jgi:hypothetical protein